MRPSVLISPAILLGLLAALQVLPARAVEPLILPHPSLLRAQVLLRQAEQDGATAMQPGAALMVQEKINAAWSAYHQQVEEKADDPNDEEAILARQLATEVELDAELLWVTLRTHEYEAQLDHLRASMGLPPARRPKLPSPEIPAKPELR